MIVDTSALMAILRGEPEAVQMLEAMTAADTLRLSAGSWIELSAVTSGRNAPVQVEIEKLMSTVAITIEPVSVEQARTGFRAYQEFGRGQHPARLNFGDCFAYALAKTTGEPLLFKGDDFSRTDIVAALPPRQ